MKIIQIVLVSLFIGFLHIFLLLFKTNDNKKENTISKLPTKDTIYTINNMKYIIINENVINLTKDSLECKFYLTDGL